jgi:hypothetical protein
MAGHPLSLGVLIPGLLVLTLFFTGLTAYPLIDRKITGERPPRGLLPPTPPDLANRTAAGAAGITFYGPLWAAAANDQIAFHLQIRYTPSPGSSGSSCWPGPCWRSSSPGCSPVRWPPGGAMSSCTAGKPGGS